MNFGEPSPRSVDAANGFMVERVKKTPPPRWNRVKLWRYIIAKPVDLQRSTVPLQKDHNLLNPIPPGGGPFLPTLP